MATPKKTARSEYSLIVIAALAAPLAAAAEAQFAVDVGVGSSNNIERTAGGGRDETIGSAGAQFTVQHESRRLYANIDGDLAWFDYSGSAYDSELVGTVNAATRVGLVQDRLSWSLDDSFGQTRRDLFTAPSPLNRENVNYASTGPDLQLHLDDDFTLLARGRYGLLSYEDSPLDSSRKSGALGVQHELASTATVSVNVSREHIEPHGGAVFDSYDRDEVYVDYAAKGARTALSLDAGASRVDQGGDSAGSALLRLTFTRKIGDWSSLTARLGREQTDAAGTLQAGGQPPPASLDTQSLSQVSEPYTSNYVDLAWSITGRVTSLGFGASWADENYRGASLQDRRRTDFNATATRALGPRVSGRASLQFSHYNYLRVAGDNDSRAADLGLSWRFGRRLSAEISGSYYRYTSDTVIGHATEERYWLRLRYGDSFANR